MTTNPDRAREMIEESLREVVLIATDGTASMGFGTELGDQIGEEASTLARALAKEGMISTTPPKPYLHPVTYWQAKCSECGYIQDDYGDFTAMDADSIMEQVQYGGWTFKDDRLVCDSCQEREVEQ